MTTNYDMIGVQRESLQANAGTESDIYALTLKGWLDDCYSEPITHCVDVLTRHAVSHGEWL
jgi:hypothetical protein